MAQIVRAVIRVYDLVMTHKLDADDFFIHGIQKHCAEQGRNFFLIEPIWAEPFLSGLQDGRLWPRVLLNMHSEHHDPTDIFHRLVVQAQALGCAVIDPPERARAAFDKARLHPLLEAAGLRVPPTRVVSASEAEHFVLSETDRAMLGRPFVIKPALGYGKKGVLVDATQESDLARSRALWQDERYLLQRKIIPRSLGSDPAYFRVFHVFGDTFLCWWNCYTDRYRSVTAEEEQTHGLSALRALVCQVARLTGMRFFSSEIAQDQAGSYVLIDYVNDQCHMLCQSVDARIGVPDAVVAAIAERLVRAATALMAETRQP